MPISPNVPVQPSLRISNGENEPPCPTNMPPPAPTAVPLGERSVNAVRAPAVLGLYCAARTLNRPDGYAFVESVRGHGAATLSNI
jgi:hypothetical protein